MSEATPDLVGTVAIVGFPNVGKSTLINRLTESRAAVVHETPGVTRDRKEAEARLAGRDVRLVDTAGLEEAPPDTIPGRMRASSEAALRGADLALFVVDVRTGLTPTDRAFATWLRRAGLPVPDGFCVTTEAFRVALEGDAALGALLDRLEEATYAGTEGRRAA